MKPEKVLFNSYVDACLSMNSNSFFTSMFHEPFGVAVVTSEIYPLNTLEGIRGLKKFISTFIPHKSNFKVFMTMNVNQYSNYDEIITGYEKKLFVATRLITTSLTPENLTEFCQETLSPLFTILEKNKIPLYIPRMVYTNTEIIKEIKRGEKHFIKKCLPEIILKFPDLTIILEDLISKKALQYVKNIPNSTSKVFAIISPLSFNIDEKNNKIINDPHEILTSPHFRFAFGTIKNQSTDHSFKLYSNFLKDQRKNNLRIKHLTQKFASHNAQHFLDLS